MPETLKVIIESMPKETPSVFIILSSLITPMIAIITTYIAFQQYGINRKKFKHDLFEKRFLIFSLINNIVSNLRQKDDPFSIKISGNEIIEYFSKVDSYVFLFDNDVKDIIGKINNNLNKLLDNYKLMDLLKHETIHKYYAEKKHIHYLDNEVEQFFDYFNSLDHDSQDAFIRDEFEKMEFESEAFDIIKEIEKNYKEFIKEIDKYISFKKVY